MNSSHTLQALRGSWLQRLAIAAAGLLVATLASAGSVSITGTVNASCSSWTSVSGDGTNIIYQCGGSQATSAGTITLATPTSISSGQTVNGGATRTGGNNLAVSVDYTISGAGCVSGTGTLNWDLSTNDTKAVPITGGAASGTCSVVLAANTGAPAISGSPKTVTVVSPDDPVAFDFDATPINNTSFGSGPTTVKVKRSGGSNGDWSLAMTYGGFLAGSQTPAAGTLAASAGSTVATLQFPAGSTEASVIFTPAASVPAGFPALPATGSVTITTATKIPGPGSTVGNIPIGIAAQRSFNLVAVTGCPVVANLRTFALAGQYQPVNNSLQPGQIGSYPMPAPMGTGGYVQIIQAPGTPVAADIEVWFSSCPGDVNDPLRDQVQTNQFGTVKKPCRQTYNYTGGPVYWNKNSGSISVCRLPDSGGPYYVNYRHVKIGTTTNSCPGVTCPMVGQINVTTP